jgi:hypothetical protein
MEEVDKGTMTDNLETVEVLVYRYGQPQTVIIDYDQLEKFNQYRWSMNNSGYPYSSKGSLHDFLFGKPDKGLEWDHENKNKRDYRKSNLRQVTRLQNNFNLPIRIDNTSGHKGVSWHRKNKNWVAQIHLHGQHIHLGSFANKEDAIAARKAGELRYVR